MLDRWQEIQIARQLIPAASDSSSSEDDRAPLVARRRQSKSEVEEFMKRIKELRDLLEIVNQHANVLETLVVQAISSTSSREISKIEEETRKTSESASESR